MSSDSASSAQLEFAEQLNVLFQRVEDMSWQRHADGAAKYGELKFLGADTLQEALEEVLDLINYGRYTAVKLLMLQELVAHQAADVEGSETTGAGTFIPSSVMFKGSGS